MLKRTFVALTCILWASSAYGQRDAIDLSTAVVHNSPADVASWPIRSRVLSMSMTPAGAPNDGIAMYFNARSTWPNYTPPGWDGPIQYTIWAGVRINGVWHVSGFMQMWRERIATGAPLLQVVPQCTINGVIRYNNNNFACNWAYDSRWGAMMGYQPSAGETMIFFATAGNARGVGTVTSVRERTNVVMVNLPANDNGAWNFPEAQSDLVVDLGSGGLWTLMDAASYQQINGANAKTIAVGDMDGNQVDEVVADFGSGIGIWIRWNNATWAQLHAFTADTIAMGDMDNNGRSDVLISFPGYGVYAFLNGTTWAQIHPLSASRIVVADIDGGGRDVVMQFPGYGIWVRRNTGAWSQIHSQGATDFVAGDFDGNGRDDLAIAFPAGGVWLFRNGGSWLQINTADARRLTAGDLDTNPADDLVIDFGGAGIWAMRNLATWSQIHTLGAEQMVVADLDGNATGDIVIDFGPGAGVWVLVNLASWTQAYPSSPDFIVPGNFN